MYINIIIRVKEVDDKMLTAHEILKQMKKNNLNIEPFDIKCLNPNSYNVHLSNKLKVYNNNAVLDLKTQNNCYNEIKYVRAFIR